MPINGIETAYKDRYTFAPLSQRAAQWYTLPLRFIVTHRPRLAEITEHVQMDFADYERRLTSLQGALQLIQQAYLGTSEGGALLVLEGWDTAGKGGIVRRLGWALDPRSQGRCGPQLGHSLAPKATLAQQIGSDQNGATKVSLRSKTSERKGPGQRFVTCSI